LPLYECEARPAFLVCLYSIFEPQIRLADIHWADNRWADSRWGKFRRPDFPERISAEHISAERISAESFLLFNSLSNPILNTLNFGNK